MARKASVVEKDEIWLSTPGAPAGCQSQGNSLEEAIANIKAAIELRTFKTLPADESGMSSSAAKSPSTAAYQRNAWLLLMDRSRRERACWLLPLNPLSGVTASTAIYSG